MESGDQQPEAVERGADAGAVDSLAAAVRRPRPESRADARVITHPSSADRSDRLTYYFYFDALEELCFAAGYREEPCFALLSGEPARDEGGSYLELTGFSGLQYTGDIRGMLHPLRQSISEQFDRRDERDDGSPNPVAGVFVGSRGSRGRLTEPIARAHLSLLNIPNQVVAVFDPESWEFGVYARTDEGRFVSETVAIIYQDDSTREQSPGDET